MLSVKSNVLYVKNMVCPRCIRVIKEEFHELGYDIKDIELGKVELEKSFGPEDLQQMKIALEKNGFELLDDKRTQLVERVKILIIEGIRNDIFSNMKTNISDYISDKVNMEYTHLSSIFSAVESKSIERFLIHQKVEFVKELISYGQLNIKEIADKLGYSSLQALSAQFKKETGLTPSEFKKGGDVKRNFLDNQ